MKSQMEKQILGCLVGGAMGDTLGRPVEGWDYDRIVEEYGLIEDPFADLKTAPDQLFAQDVGTDDTSLAQILCRTYLDKRGRVSPEDYSAAWLEQMDVKYYWYCMSNSYELLRSGMSARTVGGMNIVTGSGLMSVNPVAIYNACDPERAYYDAVELTSMFQRGVSIFSAGTVAAAIAEALSPDATCDSVLETAVRWAPSEPVKTFDYSSSYNMRDAVSLAVETGLKYSDPLKMREEAYNKLIHFQSFDCRETMLLAFAVFAAAKGDTQKAIIGGANIGRDTDTISSIVGQLCGALNGLDSIPADWLDIFMKLPPAGAFVSVASEMAELLNKKARREKDISETILQNTKKREM